jgi:small-conductance mechanosensitive channel
MSVSHATFAVLLWCAHANDVPPATNANPTFPARVHEQASPLVFVVPLGNKVPAQRAREASQALEAALSDGVGDSALVETEVKDSAVLVRVRGRLVATLGPADADAVGSPSLEAYAGELETRLLAFMQAEQRRSSAQEIAFHVFLSIALLLAALLTIRALRGGFARIEEALEADTAPRAPLKLFGVALLSAEALRGVKVVGLLGGRVLSYLGVLAVALVSTLSQFPQTRPWLGKLGGWTAAPLVAGIDAALRGLPGLVLAGALAVLAAAAVRLSRLLLDDIRAGRIRSRMDVNRVAPTRALLTTAVILVAAPLVVAAAFLRFDTPLETLALYAGGAVALGSVPVLASAVIGGVLLWRNRITVGDWVRVGRHAGEVTAVHLLDVTLVPTHGGTIVVPMIALAFLPVERASAPPVVHARVVVVRHRPMEELERALTQVVKSVDPSATVEVERVFANALEFSLRVPATRQERRGELLRALVQAAERGEIQLADPISTSPPVSDRTAGA